MFIKVTQKNNGATYVCIMESLRQHDKVTQKTLLSVGSSKSQEGIKDLKKESSLWY